MPDESKRPMRVALLGLALTAALYGAAAAGFFAMIWTLFQVAMWVFGGD